MKYAAFILLLVVTGFMAWRGFQLRPTPAIELEEVSRLSLELREGRLYHTNATVPFNGMITERYSEGGLKSRSEIVEGWLHGVSEGWYTNRQMQVQEHFLTNVSNGLRRKWYDDGRLLSETQIEQGAHHGRYRRWHANGQLAEDLQMLHGKAQGLSQAFHEDGSLQARVQMDQGQVIESEYWEQGEKQP